MRFFKNAFLPLSMLLIFSGFKTSHGSPVEKIGTATYKIGNETKIVEFSSLSVTIGSEKVGEKGKEKTNSYFTFTFYDLATNLAFRFHTKDKNVVNEFIGEYPLRFPGGFEDGESIHSTSVMIIDTQNGANTWQSTKGGNCTIFVKGTSVKITVKNATVLKGDEQNAFEFSLSTDKAKVKIKSEAN